MLEAEQGLDEEGRNSMFYSIAEATNSMCFISGLMPGSREKSINLVRSYIASFVAKAF